MQASSPADAGAEFERLIEEQIPGQRGVGAWQAFLRAHASLVRELATELPTITGLTLGDFDVLAQLAGGGGELRMTDLAARAYSSRSGMTRRVDRLVEEGLVRRTGTESDARSVMVALTEQGLERLRETVPVHLAGVRERFVDRLDDEELALLERTLKKVTPDCSFG
jgi:DNA-binding MarR family transcriptional regulator